MHVFDQIDIQFTFDFYSKMFLYKVIILCAVLFASTNADLDEIFDALEKALKADIDLVFELGKTALTR